MSSERDHLRDWDAGWVNGEPAGPERDTPPPIGIGEGHRFKLLPFEDIKLNRAPAYLIKGLLPREGLAVIWGPPKCGKTFWALDTAMHITLGRQYRGRKVQQGVVVYIACEGERGLGARVEAWRKERLGDQTGLVPFKLLATRLKMPTDAGQLIDEVRAQVSDPIAAIIVDTLNRAIEGSESSDEDMTAFVGAADMIREAFTCLVAVIHHCGVEGSRPRGHTSLTGAADCQIAVKRDSTGLVVAKLEWMKDGPEGDEITSRLVVVELGTDDEGDTITSCVVEAADGQETAHADHICLSDQAKILLQEIKNCLADAGEDAPASTRIPRSRKVVRIDLLRTAFGQANGTKSDKPDNVRRVFQRQLAALKTRGIIGVWDDFVWLAGQSGQPRTTPDMFDDTSRTTPDTPL